MSVEMSRGSRDDRGGRQLLRRSGPWPHERRPALRITRDRWPGAGRADRRWGSPAARPQHRSNSYKAVSNSPRWRAGEEAPIPSSIAGCRRPRPRRAGQLGGRSAMLARRMISRCQARSSARSRTIASSRRQLSAVIGSFQPYRSRRIMRTPQKQLVFCILGR